MLSLSQIEKINSRHDLDVLCGQMIFADQDSTMLVLLEDHIIDLYLEGKLDDPDYRHWRQMVKAARRTAEQREQEDLTSVG